MRYACLLVMGCLPLMANASIIRQEIPVAELKGVYSSSGDVAPEGSDYFSFSCPGFARIDAVYLDITGNVAPALVHYQSTGGQGGGSDFEEYPWWNFVLDQSKEDLVHGGRAGLTWRERGPFHVREALVGRGSGPGDFSFLLDGQGAGFFRLLKEMVMGGPVGEEVIPSIVAITDARLIIEGVAVPEPGAVVGLLAGVGLLMRRRVGVR